MAAVITLLIHAVIIFVLLPDFGTMNSSNAGDEDDEMFLQLEELLGEEIEIAPSGGSQKSNLNNENVISEPSNGESEAIKLEQENIIEDKEKLVQEIPDTVPIPKIEPIAIVKPDTISTQRTDSAIAALIEMTQSPAKKQSTKSSGSSYRERYEFYKKNARLVYNFKKVYPYALKTREILENVNTQLATMQDEDEKKKLIKETEKMLFREYEGAVRTMSTSQGKLLLKLIARETNKSGYEIIREYRGAFSASFWYGVGKIFNADLKMGYNKGLQEDSLIEDVLDKYKRNDLY